MGNEVFVGNPNLTPSSYCTWLLTNQPLLALRLTARLLFMVDSRNFCARRSQKSMMPIPVPMVRMLPLKDTDRMPHPLLRDGIFFTACRRG